jgi:hypothetical protein
MRTQLRCLLTPVITVLAVSACSDGNNNNHKTPVDPTPEPISIETPNADRCEILDSTNCMFPWPSNAFTVADDATDTGLRINLNQQSLPANKQGVQVDPAEWNRNDGFSPSQMIIAQVPGVDLDETGAPPITDLSRSLDPDSPIVVIDANTGEQHLIFAELDANTDEPAEQTLMIRPMVQFERGGHYIVALRQLRDSAGELLEAPAVFRAFRDNTPTDNEAIESRRESMEAMFATLEDAGIARDELYLAWDFQVASVRNITERILHIRDDAFASLGNAAPGFTVTEVQDFAPCDDSGCAEGQDQYKSRTILGTFTVPNYLNTDAGGPGSAFYYAEPDDGLPDRMGGDNTYTAKFYCSIPRSVAEDFTAPPKAIARPSLYGHGLLGSGSEALRGTGANVNIMADDHQMLFCGTDLIGFSSEDVGYATQVLQDFSLIQPFFDRQQQGLLNFMYLARLLKHPQGLRSDPAFQAAGEPVFDNSNVYYDGNSQGGIIGGGLMGVIQDVTRGVLGVPGMSYSMLLRRSIDFATYSLFFTGSNTGDTGGGYPSVKDQTFLLSMAQMLWDRAEASGYAYHIERPLPNTPAHAVLMQVAFGDHQVSMWTAEAMARTIGARLRVPATEPGRHPDSNPYFALEPVPAGDYTGSVLTVWDDGPIGGGGSDGGTAAPPITNLPPFEPDYGADPHSLPRKDSNAQAEKSWFLMPDGVGKFVDTCDPTLPCTTDGYIPGGGS